MPISLRARPCARASCSGIPVGGVGLTVAIPVFEDQSDQAVGPEDGGGRVPRRGSNAPAPSRVDPSRKRWPRGRDGRFDVILAHRTIAANHARHLRIFRHQDFLRSSFRTRRFTIGKREVAAVIRGAAARIFSVLAGDDGGGRVTPDPLCNAGRRNRTSISARGPNRVAV